MKTKLLIATAMCFACVSHSVAAEAPKVIARTSRASVQVADPFSLDLKVTAPAGSKVTFPALGDRLGDFDVLRTHDVSDIPSADTSALRTWTRRMTLESIVTGDLEIPSVEIHVTGDGGSQTIQSNPIAVRVASVLEGRSDPAQFRDIQSVVDLTIPTAETNSLAWWGLGGFGLLAAALAIGMVVSRRDKWMTPKQWAIERLDQLEESTQTSIVDEDASTAELSNIVRDFLLMQFEIPESGCTSQELVQRLEREKQLDEKTVGELGALFVLADKAKFAGWEISPDGLQSAIRGTRRLIEVIESEPC